MSTKGSFKVWFLANRANFITVFRLFCSVCLVPLAAGMDNIFPVFVLMALCGVSDFLDGWVARHYKITSQIGAILDQVADKVFIFSAIFLIWLYRSAVDADMFWTELLIAAIILLEIFHAAGWFAMLIKKLHISSGEWGRTKMALQLLAVLGWFFCLTLERHLEIKIMHQAIFVINALFAGVIIMAVANIVGYKKRCRKLIEAG